MRRLRRWFAKWFGPPPDRRNVDPATKKALDYEAERRPQDLS